MGALLYLKKRMMANRIRKALKRPVTYLYVAFGIFYAFFIVSGIGVLVAKVKFNSPVGLVALMTVWTFYSLPGNFISYANRKGIIFRPCQSQFVFTTPVHPKLVLLDSAMLNLLTSLIASILLSVCAVWVFQVPLYRVLLFFMVCFVLEIVLEYSVILLLYGSDRFAEGKFKTGGRIIKGILLASVLLLVLYFRKNGLTLESITGLMDSPALRMIPVIGWNVCAFRWILLGADLYNIIGTALYLLTVAGVTLAAWRMENTGAYYEDAARYADDYLEYRNRNKRGEASFSVGGRKRFREAKVHFQGGAKAIFYRQLLEYKKEKFFIFNYMTLLCAGLSILLAYLWRYPKTGLPGLYLLGILAYIAFLTTGYTGKWDKELKNPYLFLIPDTPFKKMWNATKMDHFKAFVDGAIMSVIIGIAWKIPVWQVIMCILIYVMMQACKLYMKVLTLLILGDTMGKTGRDILRVFIQSTALGVGLLLAVVCALAFSQETVFVILFLYSIAAAAGVAALASMKFQVLEQAE